MPTISRRLRTVLRPTRAESEDLEALRTRTRAVLNRPYRFEPKTFLKPWETQGADPFAGLFKPFSKVLPIATVSTAANTFTKSRRHSWMMLVPVMLLGLGLAAFIAYQSWHTSTGLSSLVPRMVKPPTTNLGASTATANPVKVPTNTPLQPAGPYTSSGQTRTNPTGSTGLSASAPSTNMQSGSGTTGSSSGGTVNGASTSCPSGKVCTGNDLTGQACTISSPCTPVNAGSIPVTGISTAATLIQSFPGYPCPCYLSH